jgi:hypothetical protein
MMDYQSRDAEVHARMSPPAVFSYPPRGWRFATYLKSLTDEEGQFAISHRPGRFAYKYVLTLFIVTDLSQSLVEVGKSNGIVATKQAQAISQYINRITQGIGWKETAYTAAGVGGNPGSTPAPYVPPVAPVSTAPGGGAVPSQSNPGALHG